MRKRALIAVLLVNLCLSGCSSDDEVLIAECQGDAKSFFPLIVADSPEGSFRVINGSDVTIGTLFRADVKDIASSGPRWMAAYTVNAPTRSIQTSGFWAVGPVEAHLKIKDTTPKRISKTVLEQVEVAMLPRTELRFFERSRELIPNLDTVLNSDSHAVDVLRSAGKSVRYVIVSARVRAQRAQLAFVPSLVSSSGVVPYLGDYVVQVGKTHYHVHHSCSFLSSAASTPSDADPYSIYYYTAIGYDDREKHIRVDGVPSHRALGTPH